MAKKEKILPHQQAPGEDELIQYLQERLSPEETHEIEMQMAESAFVNDAVEGLQAFQDKKNIAKLTQELNQELLKKTSKNKKRKGLKSYQQQDWIQLIVIIVILLCLLSYFMVQLYEKNFHHTIK
jgi:DNA primase large subunit